MTTAQKAEYVKNATNTDAAHHCHWPGCNKAVKPAMWGCSPHWYKLPQTLRNQIWATYKPGQENSKTPSTTYLHVAGKVQEWIKAQTLKVRGWPQ